jgi:hypothetical protein
MRCDARTDAGPRHRLNLPGLMDDVDVMGLCVVPEVTPVRASGLLLSAFRKHLPEAWTNENHLQPRSDSAHLVQHASALAAATSPIPTPGHRRCSRGAQIRSRQRGESGGADIQHRRDPEDKQTRSLNDIGI